MSKLNNNMDASPMSPASPSSPSDYSDDDGFVNIDNNDDNDSPVAVSPPAASFPAVQNMSASMISLPPVVASAPSVPSSSSLSSTQPVVAPVSVPVASLPSMIPSSQPQVAAVFSPEPVVAVAPTTAVVVTKVEAEPVSPQSRIGAGLDVVAPPPAMVASSQHQSAYPSTPMSPNGGIRETGGTPLSAECSLCEASAPAFEMCKQCSLFCCQAHGSLHLREKGNGNHTMISLSRYAPNSFWTTIGQQLPLMRISRTCIWENKHIHDKKGYYAPLAPQLAAAAATPLIPALSAAEQIQIRESKDFKGSPVAAGTPIIRKSVVLGGVVPTVVQNNHVFIDLHDRITEMQHSTRVYGGETPASYRHFMSQYQKWCDEHPLIPANINDIDNKASSLTAPSANVDAAPSATFSSWGLGENKGEQPAVPNGPFSPEAKEGQYKTINEQQVEGGEVKRPLGSAVLAGVTLPYRTTVGVVQRDCLDEAREQISMGKRVALLNLASRINICGAWDNPYLGTQEECIERRSAVYRHGMDWRQNPTFAAQLIDISEREGRGQWQWRNNSGQWERMDEGAAVFLSRLTNDSADGTGTYRIGKYEYGFNLIEQTQTNLQTKRVRSIRYTGVVGNYHIPMFGSVLHRGVPIIRNAQWQLYQPDLSFNVDIIAAAGIDLRTRFHGKTDFSKYAAGGGGIAKSIANLFKRATLSDLNVPLFIEHTKWKIRCIYSTAIMNGYTSVVLGALGCGAFCNDTNVVARCFREVLQESQYMGRFESVVFAILGAPAIEFAQEFAHWPAVDAVDGMAPVVGSHVLASVAAPDVDEVKSAVPSAIPSAAAAAPLPVAEAVPLPQPPAPPVTIIVPARRNSIPTPLSPGGPMVANDAIDIASPTHLP